MQYLEVSCAVRPIEWPLDVKRLTTLVGRFSGIRTQSGQTKINGELNA